MIDDGKDENTLFSGASTDTPRTLENTATFPLLRDVFDAMQDGAALYDEELRLVLCNDKYEQYLFPPGFHDRRPGQSATEQARAIIQSDFFIVPKEPDIKSMPDAISDLIRSYTDGLELKRSDGRYFAIVSKRTSLGGFLVTVNDITAEQQAKKSEKKRLDAVGALEEGFALWDENLKFVLCNDKYLDLQIPREEAPKPGESAYDFSRRLFKYFNAPEGTTIHEFAVGTVDRLKNYQEDMDFYRKDGATLRVAVKKTGLGGYLITLLDITEERNTEQKARNMLVDAIQALDEGLCLFDKDMKLVFANKAWANIFFRSHPIPDYGEMAGDILFELIEGDFYSLPEGVSKSEFMANIVDVISSYKKNLTLMTSDGRQLISSSHETELGGFLLSCRDVTEERNSNQRAQNLLLDAIESLDEGLCLYDKDMRFVAANKAWGDIYFRSRVPQIGEHAAEVMGHLIDRGFYTWPEGVTRDGFIGSVIKAIQSNTKGLALTTADGRHLIGSSHATEVGGYLLSCRDITKQVETEEELEKQRAIANQNEKLSALGELLAGVAHELNNPLSVVFGYAQMLQDKVDDPVINERIGLIGQSAERAAKIVKTFLAMARQRPTKIVAFSLNDAVSTALEVSSYSLKSNGTEVLTDLDKTIPFVDGDFDQLAQVFSNLIVNAGHAVKDLGDEGRLSIQSSFDTRSDVVIVKIKDNGPGIPEDIQARIFEPFFTTKDVGEGTGVGLAFSHRIIASHNGELSLHSINGCGATFSIKLPISTQTVPAAALTDEENAQYRSKSVLIVDDEEGVAQLIFDILSEQGLLVTKTTSPRTALGILESQTFDIILSDFKMPGMDGEHFFEALSVVAPECIERVGFITGDAMSENVRSFFLSSGRPYIEKPVLKDELFDLIEGLSAEYEEG